MLIVLNWEICCNEPEGFDFSLALEVCAKFLQHLIFFERWAGDCAAILFAPGTTRRLAAGITFLAQAFLVYPTRALAIRIFRERFRAGLLPVMIAPAGLVGSLAFPAGGSFSRRMGSGRAGRTFGRLRYGGNSLILASSFPDHI
jgi:hypothetical protein